MLTITSTLVEAASSSPRAHQKGTFAPDYRPKNSIDTHGMVASMLSVTPSSGSTGRHLSDNTITSGPWTYTRDEQITNLVGILDAGFV